MHRVLVTGSSGFIGTNLVEHYRSREDVEVLGFDSREPRCAPHRSGWVRGDLLEPDDVRGVLRDFQPTHLVHLAARTDLTGASMQDYRVNTDGSKVLLACLDVARPLQRTVIASSRIVCDLGQVPSCDYDYCPPNYYGRSKVIVEQLVRAHAWRGDWVIVRPTSIWGPWGETPYREFFLSVGRGRYLHPGRERVVKHYGYVGNVVHQVDRLLVAPSQRVHGRTFYLADFEATEVGAFAAAIRSAMGQGPVRSAPVPLLRALALAMDAAQALGLRNPPLTSSRLSHLRTPMLFDLDEVADVVGPLPFTLEQGVRETVAHLQAQGDLRPAA